MFGNILLWGKFQGCVTEVDGRALNGSFKKIIYSAYTFSHSIKRIRKFDSTVSLHFTKVMVFTTIQ